MARTRGFCTTSGLGLAWGPVGAEPCGRFQSGKEFDGSRELTKVSVAGRYGGAGDCGGGEVGGVSRSQIAKGLWAAVKELEAEKGLDQFCLE